MEYEEGYKERRRSYEDRSVKVSKNLWFLTEPRGIDIMTEMSFETGGREKMSKVASDHSPVVDVAVDYLKTKHPHWKDTMVVYAPLGEFTIGSTVPFLHSVEVDPLKEYDEYGGLEGALKTLCHEFQHVEQHSKGFFDEEGPHQNFTMFHGKKYTNEFYVGSHDEYRELPWEAEAFSEAEKTYPLLLKHLLKKGVVRYAAPDHKVLEVVR